jgi:phosphoribosylformylglycinamidine cyclo-ligase
MKQESIYEQRGVSSGKEEVHAAIKKLDKGLFPGAFSPIFPDIFGRPDHVMAMHADGAGTKAVLAYLYWKHTRDLNVWKGIAQDSFVMNLDDMLCDGITGPFRVTMSIDRNKKLIPGEVIAVLIDECDRLCRWLTDQGVPCVFCGGETADVGDAVRTITVNNTFSSSVPKTDIIDAGNITAPAYIVGFSSAGKANWETSENSGIRSNGLTNGRHDVLSPVYRDDKETYAPEIDTSLIYRGQHRLEDPLPGDDRFTIGSALLSPTRTYLPMILELFGAIGRENILGLIHCSGGGMTKSMKYGQPGITYLKDSPFPISPFFSFLKKAGDLSWKEMYSTYNMRCGLEAIVKTEKIAQTCIAIASTCGIEAKITGQVIENKENPNGRSVIIKNEFETLRYDFQ